jgi:hypothetical protein
MKAAIAFTGIASFSSDPGHFGVDPRSFPAGFRNLTGADVSIRGDVRFSLIDWSDFWNEIFRFLQRKLIKTLLFK